jgi:pilus assembly protein FimV
MSQTQDMMSATTSLDLAATQDSEIGAGLDFTMSFDETPPAKASESSFDMPLDMNTTMETMPATSGFDMDFNLGESAAADTGSNVVDFALPESPAPSSEGIDFSMPSTGKDSAIEFNIGSLEETAPEFPAVSVEANGNGDGGLPGWDETATKLDLAKAYIDMGDSEGARSILDEVIQEGNDSQKQQARDLASQIAA